MFNRQIYDNSRGDGHPVLEMAPPTTVGENESPEILFVPLKQSYLSGTVTGPLAQLKLKQVFQFSSQENPDVIEAIYRFPLPGDSALTGVKVRFGEVEIDTVLKSRQQAETDYEQARQEGRQAVLVNRETANVFTLAINGIKPGQTVEIETSFVELARSDGNDLSLRIPLTTSPRYVRRDEAHHRQAQGQPLLSMRDPGHRFAMNIEINGSHQVTASGIPLSITHSAGNTLVSLEGGEILPDRDLFLQWHSSRTAEIPELQVYSWQDPADSMVYFLAGLKAPEADEKDSIPREVIILVDHSGSMTGAKWAAADWAVKAFLNQLQPDDRFNLGVFHSNTFWWSEQPQTGTIANIKAAGDYLDRQKSSGGTELGIALEQALAMNRARGKITRHVLLITDAEVSDMGRILALVNQESAEQSHRRISVLCIDSAPNALLANEIADRSGGRACFLTSRPEEEDISSALDRILESFARPLYSDGILEVSSPDLEGSRQAVLETMEESWKALDAGDIPPGAHRWINGRLPASSRQTIDFEFYATGLQDPIKMTHHLDQNQYGSSALKALFGAGRLAVLEELLSYGLTGDEVESMLKRLHYTAPNGQNGRKMRYAENQQLDLRHKVTGMLSDESLRYGLLSSETSFTAVRSEAGERAEYTVLVPNAQPEGWEFPGAAGGFAGGAAGLICPAPPSTAPQNLMMSYAALPQKASEKMRTRLPKLMARRAAPASPVSRDMYADMSLEHLTKPATSEIAGRGLIEESRGTAVREMTVCEGAIKLVNGASTLFDSSDMQKPNNWAEMPSAVTFKRITFEFISQMPDPAGLPRNTLLLIFCGDSAVPASRIRLAELLRQSGQRPLNISWTSGQLLKLVLEDPGGRLDGAEIAVRLEW